MAHTTAVRVADVILHFARERQIEITNLKLQKLLYYCQAWHLALLDEPLFPERIEAWVHGPVVPPVFGIFKHYRWLPIDPPGTDVSVDAGDSRRAIETHIAEVMDAYGALTGPQLEALTHSEAPWREARKGIPGDQPSTQIISHEAMIAFYRPQIRRVNA